MDNTPLLVAVLAIWEIFWTGSACWYAARKGEKAWFVFFMVITLAGIPEILYVVQQRKQSGQPD